jgi:hypothetical protein
VIVDVTDESDRLLAMAKLWNATDPAPPGHKQEVRSIGQHLHAKGGWDLMSAVYDHVRERRAYPHLIEAWWDGIGDWRW